MCLFLHFFKIIAPQSHSILVRGKWCGFCRRMKCRLVPKGAKKGADLVADLVAEIVVIGSGNLKRIESKNGNQNSNGIAVD